MTRLRVAEGTLRKPRVELRGAELRYLRSVLRLGPGTRIELFDGAGEALEAEIVSIGPSAAELSVVGRVAADRESPLELTLAVALSKAAKLDWVVEKAAELGVRRILPFTSERTIPERDRFSARQGRWRRIAGAAAAQSGRRRCPEISEVTSFSAVLSEAVRHEIAVLFWEDSREALGTTAARSAIVVTGPEGGLSEAEVVAARAAGFRIASLGPRMLRAETAAVVGATLAQLWWGDLRLVSGKSAP